MGSIKQLPEAVHSSLRSSVHLFDLARVVEELVYNSVDAGASKVNQLVKFLVVARKACLTAFIKRVLDYLRLTR